MVRSILLAVLILMSGGCAVYKSSFDCPHKKGVGCESVSKVNELINNDELDEFTGNIGRGKKRGKSACKACDSVDLGQKKKATTEVWDAKEKLKIHFNEYEEERVLYKASAIEVGVYE